MIFKNIIRIEKSNKPIMLQLIVSLLNKSIDNIGATEVKETNAKLTWPKFNHIALQRTSEENANLSEVIGGETSLKSLDDTHTLRRALHDAFKKIISVK
jgi:hypothetical protein